MHRLRSYFDADREDKVSVPTTFLTAQNKNELYCSMCGENVFVDDLIFDDVNRVIEETSENPFMCEECLDDYDEVAY